MYFCLSVFNQCSDNFTIKSNGDDSFSFNFLAPNGQSFASDVLPGETTFGCGVSFCVYVNHTDTQAANDSKEIVFTIYPESGSTIGLTGTYALDLEGSVVNSGNFDAWIYSCWYSVICEFTSSHASNASSVAEPAVARDAVTVGSYTTKNCWDSQIGQQCYSHSPTLGGISNFSSLGPTRDGR